MGDDGVTLHQPSIGSGRRQRGSENRQDGGGRQVFTVGVGYEGVGWIQIAQVALGSIDLASEQ